MPVTRHHQAQASRAPVVGLHTAKLTTTRSTALITDPGDILLRWVSRRPAQHAGRHSHAAGDPSDCQIGVMLSGSPSCPPLVQAQGAFRSPRPRVGGGLGMLSLPVQPQRGDRSSVQRDHTDSMRRFDWARLQLAVPFVMRERPVLEPNTASGRDRPRRGLTHCAQKHYGNGCDWGQSLLSLWRCRVSIARRGVDGSGVVGALEALVAAYGRPAVRRGA